jgi:carboxyl-terminal processing protease
VQRQYHGITRREYYRLAGADRDTVGRPNCRTDAGRVAYGGGGIYPDVMLAENDEVPRWLANVRENDLVLRWIGGYMTANSASLPPLETLAAQPALPAAPVADFKSFAGQQGVVIPAEADSVLQRMLLRAVARARFGEEGYYRMAAVLDPVVRRAARQFDRASAILAKAP